MHKSTPIHIAIEHTRSRYIAIMMLIAFFLIFSSASVCFALNSDRLWFYESDKLCMPWKSTQTLEHTVRNAYPIVI